MQRHRLTLPPIEQIQSDVARALAEDVGNGDATAALLPIDAVTNARVITREQAVLAGASWFDACFHALDPNIEIVWLARDGESVGPNSVLCTLRGKARALVTGERSALNFLQTLSGTATATAVFVAAVRDTRTVILDTRKTIPGLRLAQKYAVRAGGGSNHRMGLYDAILIKENHIAAAGSIPAAVKMARELHPNLLLEIEVESFEELRQAFATNVDRILLDEFSLDEIRAAVALVGGRVPLEVSGGVGLDALQAIAATGIDYISVGALTKHIRAVDLSMRIGYDI